MEQDSVKPYLLFGEELFVLVIFVLARLELLDTLNLLLQLTVVGSLLLHQAGDRRGNNLKLGAGSHCDLICSAVRYKIQVLQFLMHGVVI